MTVILAKEYVASMCHPVTPSPIHADMAILPPQPHAGFHHGTSPTRSVERPCAGVPQGHRRGPLPGSAAQHGIEDERAVVFEHAAWNAAPLLPRTAGCETDQGGGSSSAVEGEASDIAAASWAFHILDFMSTVLYRMPSHAGRVSAALL